MATPRGLAVGARASLESAQGGVTSRVVGVEEQHDVARELAQLLQLWLRQRRSHGGNDVLVPGLNEPDHVRVALDDDRLPSALAIDVRARCRP